jgi:hypothetical protein
LPRLKARRQTAGKCDSLLRDVIRVKRRGEDKKRNKQKEEKYGNKTTRTWLEEIFVQFSTPADNFLGTI